MAAPDPTSKHINFVDRDEIWKVRVKIEKESAKAWPNKWGFLTETYQEMQRETVRLELPPHLKTRPLTPPEEYIHVGPSPSVPQTSQALIGWRSAQSQLQLENFGMVHHGRRSFLKDLV
ncbi:ciliary microtubule inner protein 1-like [Polymixia lowei]